MLTTIPCCFNCQVSPHTPHQQFDVVMLSPAISCERNRSNRSSPSKQTHAHSPPNSHSHSGSPPCQHRHQYASMECSCQNSSPRCSHCQPSTRGKGRGSDQTFFQGVQQCVVAPLVLFVWDATSTNMPNVQPPSSGMEERCGYTEMNMGGLSESMTSPSASISKPWQDAQ